MILRHLEPPATANDFATCHVTLFGWRNGGLGLVSAELRTAINIKTALDHIRQLQQIGYCPTKVQAFRQQFQMDDDVASDGLEVRARDLANQVCKRGM
jgi:hypothetical protein